MKHSLHMECIPNFYHILPDTCHMNHIRLWRHNLFLKLVPPNLYILSEAGRTWNVGSLSSFAWSMKMSAQTSGAMSLLTWMVHKPTTVHPPGIQKYFASLGLSVTYSSSCPIDCCVSSAILIRSSNQCSRSDTSIVTICEISST